MAAAAFHDRDGKIWFDGQMIDWRSANVHVLTHALHYSGAVFEGERVYGGQVFKLREHTQRLLDSAKMMGYELPYTLEQLEAATMDVIHTQKIVDGYVRPVAWRGSEMMGVAAQKNTIHVAIATWEWPSYFDPEAKTKGIRLMMGKWKRPSPETAPVHAKASNLYAICTMGKHEAERNGFHDALMLDWRGQVAEATGANFFMVIKGEIHTPTPDCFLDGITRRTVIDLAKARGIKVIERVIMPDELKGADEIFLTGTAAEVTAVGTIGELTFKVGPVTQMLADDYSKEVRKHAATKAA
ncbi:MAG: branched-chain amino acid aminotransferase [Alphaproteobacteria bacterium]|nr:branched-chain amino acid aminotransferase [Alphaproteobacteria bacterium]